tara:strand:- start:7448 stop:7672 length:225 start_codon:yes stop_codon:yes gene_type:complete
MKRFKIHEAVQDALKHNYRKATIEDADRRCDKGCSYWHEPNICTLFDFECRVDHVCDKWKSSSERQGLETGQFE